MPAAKTLPPRPGWYADPADPDGDGFRWWDGEGWTALRSPTEDAPWPNVRLNHVVPTTRRRPRGIVWAIVAVLLAVLLIGLSLIGQRIGAPQRPGTVAAPTSIGPAPREYEPFNTEDSFNIVVYEQINFEVRFFELDPTLGREVPGVLTPARAFNYQGAAGAALVVVGIMNEAVTGATPEESARRTLAAAVSAVYTDNVTAGEITVEPYPAVSRAVIATTTPQGTPDRDTATLIAIPFEAGSVHGYAVWMSVLGDDADPAAVVEVEKSRQAIRRL